MSDLSYKAINARIFHIINERDEAIREVQAALINADIDLQLKIRLVETVSENYQPELDRLNIMARVAEWHELAEKYK